jgi:hypothetical protein
MNPSHAFEMGYRAAAAGFFFDSLELIAACSVHVGGIDNLRGAIELVFADRDETNANVAWLANTLSGAFKQPWSAPRGVDEYRLMLTAGVFEVVNRWSYIDDVKQVTRLQAWFYAGFGLGRARTVTLGLQMYERMRNLVAVASAADDMPANLHRMAAEAVKQMQVAAEEDDLRSVRPMLEDNARRLQLVAVVLLRERAEISYLPAHVDDLRAIADTLRRIRLDLTHTGTDR